MKSLLKTKGIILIMVLLISILLSACRPPQRVPLDKNKKTVTVTTSFLGDMVQELVGDKVNVLMVIPAGEDPHLYAAKPQDIEKIASADLLLYHGLHFEGKMVEILEKRGTAVSENFPKSELIKMDDGAAGEIDPHFWFDISLYKDAVKSASNALQKLLPEEKEWIMKNQERYLKELTALDVENRQKISQIPKNSRYLITPHDAFYYFSKCYGMEVVAPQGMSTQSETANRAVEKTVDFIVRHKVKAIFAESTTDPARMQKLKEAAAARGFDVKVVHGDGKELFSDSLAPKGQPGDTYIRMYQHNMDLIVKNLK